MGTSDAASSSPKIKRKAKAIPPYSTLRERYDRVEVKESVNCGLGLFAKGAIKKGHAVGQVHGDLKPKDFRSHYCVEFGDNALEPHAPYRFLNHCCEPNCQFIEWHIDAPTPEDADAEVLELWVHALRDIEIGEELTIDYGWDWESAIPCKCGSPNCRGWICKEEELELCRERRGAGSYAAKVGEDDNND